MSIGEAEAIAAAREFERERGGGGWDEKSITVHVETVADRDAWVVIAREAFDPGEPAWTQINWPPLRYFIDRETGRIFGIATERSSSFFD